MSDELEYQRIDVVQALLDWRDAGADVHEVLEAIEALIEAKIEQHQPTFCEHVRCNLCLPPPQSCDDAVHNKK